MGKIHLKKNKKIKKSNIIIIIIVLIIISVIKVLGHINTVVTPVIVEYAGNEAKKIVTLVINQAVNQQVIKNLDSDDLFITNTDSDQKITSIDFNPSVINNIYAATSNKVQDYLEKLQQGKIKEIGLENNNLFSNSPKLEEGIIFYITSGVALNNAILDNIGPKIPVKLNFIGNVVSEIGTSIENYGINNALIKVNINVTITEQIILPYVSKEVTINASIPLAMKIVQGDIPNYYFNGNPLSSNSNSLTNN